MADTWLYASVAATALAATSWLRHSGEARQQSRHIKKRLGVKGRWDDAFDIEDEELLLDPLARGARTPLDGVGHRRYL